MKFRVRLLAKDGKYEVFSFCAYTIKRFRLRPSLYRYPFWSLSWGWLTVTLSGFNHLLGPEEVA